MLDFQHGKIKISNKALTIIGAIANSRAGLAVLIAVIFGFCIIPELRGMRADIQTLVVSANRAEVQLSRYGELREKLDELKELLSMRKK